MDKTTLRKQYLKLRNGLSPSDTSFLSSRITSSFLSSSRFQKNSSFLLYLNVGNEVVTRNIIDHAVEAGKKVYLPDPVIINEKIRVAQFESWDSMVKGAYGIAFPDGKAVELKETDITIVVMPGIAFDTKGNRIGFGKGFYDRLLGDLQIEKVALAYDFQIHEGQLPEEEHDVRTETLFTEKRTIICNNF